MLNPFGNDYNLTTIRGMFLHDPSLPWAITAMAGVYHLGTGRPWLRRAAVPAFTASLPLSIWLWDIPFTGRIICRNFHDGRVVLFHGLPLTTKWVYVFCFIIYLAFQAILLRRQRATRVRA
jgi:hypothetical protein